MRTTLAIMALFPAHSWACDSMAAMAAMPAASGGCAHGHGGGFLPIALMAAVAVLGVWVLRSGEKDLGAVKRAGQVVGWALVVAGLLGFLCGAVSHAVKGWSTHSCRSGAGPSPVLKQLPPGHPPIDPSGK